LDCRKAAARFTPTRVGTTVRDYSEYIAPTVHPHACGDNYGKVKEVARAHGSPPRVWGQQ